MTGYPYRFERTAAAGDLVARHTGLAPETNTGERVSVAGRVMLLRHFGAIAFATLVDSSGRIQLYATEAKTPRFEDFAKLSIGDWVGVSGEVVTTRRGELSVTVDEWTVLAETKRPFPDKWHGLTDPDTRYRQRYVDLWASEDSRRVFQTRAAVIRHTRRWLEDRGFVEAETPVLQPDQGGATARPFITHHNTLDMPLYLRIAGGELYLKRLIGGGIEKVFELGRVFRNEGISPRHNPEFTMLEVYEAYSDYGDMMAICEQLVAAVAEAVTGSCVVTHGGREIDLTPPWRRATLADLVQEHAGVDVDQPADVLRTEARRLHIPTKPAWGPGKLALEIYEKTTEAALWGPVFVLDYPQEVSPLARPHRSKPGYVERFEAIIAGRELANAYSELVDPVLQRQRLEEQVGKDDESMAVDEDYIRALEYGLPPTGGLGIGIDRLVMLLTDASNIRDVVFFPTLRPEQTTSRQPGGDDGGEPLG